MGSPYLSDDLNAFIEATQSNNGFDIQTLAENVMFEIHTQNSVYTIVVLDPKICAIALMGNRESFEEPDLFSFLGAAWGMGTSAVKVGWVGVGLHFRFKSITGRLFTTTKVKNFVMLNDEVKAKEIRDKAMVKHPDALNPDVEGVLKAWQADFESKIEKDFAGEHLPEVQRWLGEFCINGKCNAASFFAAAKTAGKLSEALALMPRHFKDHWAYKAPEIRGDINTPMDNHQWILAFQEAGVPLPQ